jgi:hypothetical protein
MIRKTVFLAFALALALAPALSCTALQLQSFAISPFIVNGGDYSAGRVVLTANAPAGGVNVALSADSPAVTIPPSVTVPAGSQSAIFSIGTSHVAVRTTVHITATFGISKTATLTIRPN